MPNDVKAIVSALTLAVAAILAYWSGSPISARFLHLHHGDGHVYGGGDVDFPRSRGEKG